MELTKDLLTGVELVDNQHLELVTRVNNLFACTSNETPGQIENMLDFLAEYVVTHFNCEEELQKEVAYPDYELHKKMHDDLINIFVLYRNKYKDSGASIEVIVNVCQMLFAWLEIHIGVSDCNFAKFYREAKNK